MLYDGQFQTAIVKGKREIWERKKGKKSNVQILCNQNKFRVATNTKRTGNSRNINFSSELYDNESKCLG